MKIDIYTSAINGSKYIAIMKGAKIEELTLPADIDADLLTLSPFRTRLEIDASKEHSALDQQDVLQQLQEKNYAIFEAKFQVQLNV